MLLSSEEAPLECIRSDGLRVADCAAGSSSQATLGGARLHAMNVVAGGSATPVSIRGRGGFAMGARWELGGMKAEQSAMERSECDGATRSRPTSRRTA